MVAEMQARLKCYRFEIFATLYDLGWHLLELRILESEKSGVKKKNKIIFEFLVKILDVSNYEIF
jgi:ASC-1-like (ASCH) protein